MHVQTVATQLFDYLIRRDEQHQMGGSRADVQHIAAPRSMPARHDLSSSQLEDLVTDALRHLHSVGTLGEHTLIAALSNNDGRLHAQHHGHGSRLERGRILQTVLLQVIERLRPEGRRPAHLTTGWLQYLILHGEYVNGRPNKELACEFHISEATFHRTRRQAVAHLAAELAAQEASASKASEMRGNESR